MSHEPTIERGQQPRAEAIRTCLTCGRKFKRSGRQRYCSPACRPSTYRLIEAVRTCLTCGHEFQRCRRQRYCSPACRPSSYQPVRVRKPKGYRIPEEGREKRRRSQELWDAGWPLSKIAAELGISPQRVHQLLRSVAASSAPPQRKR